MTAAAVLTDHVCPNKLNPVAISGNCKWSFIKKAINKAGVVYMEHYFSYRPFLLINLHESINSNSHP